MMQLLDSLITSVAGALGMYDFVFIGLLAVILTSLICGSVGPLVVANRMAFFTDALAHCSFAGVALGIIIALVSGHRDNDTFDWMLPLVMIGFGVLVGIGIAYVRERTTLASDTVIGVFFAAALGLGALLFGALKVFTNKSPESFLFGNPLSATSRDLLWLIVLAGATAVVLIFRYNQLVFASFNPSLARSRQIAIRLNNYLFIALLALIVNICLQAVGILLINAMILVPAATAINFRSNMRRLYWWTVAVSLLTGLGGFAIGWYVHIPVRGTKGIPIGMGGCIILLTVLAFAVSMVVGPRLRKQAA